MSNALKAPGFRGILLMVVMFARACVWGEKEQCVTRAAILPSYVWVVMAASILDVFLRWKMTH